MQRVALVCPRNREPSLLAPTPHVLTLLRSLEGRALARGGYRGRRRNPGELCVRYAVTSTRFWTAPGANAAHKAGAAHLCIPAVERGRATSDAWCQQTGVERPAQDANGHWTACP